jgi:hypothetical protein
MLRFYRKTLISLFRDLNRLSTDPKDVSLCFSIQERLLTYIRRIEYRIRVLKGQNISLRNTIGHARLPREETIKLKQQLELNDFKKQSYDQILNILRDIGDGIAFIYLDKWDIKPLCMSKEHAGFISGKKGIRLELKIFRLCKSQNIICIFNDITNAIRYGDITVLKHGIPQFIEAKSGHFDINGGRTQRQLERARNILNYLVHDHAEGVYPGQGEITLQRRELPIKERHHQIKLKRLLVKAMRSQRNTTLKIENGLYYNVSVSVGSVDKELNKLPKGAKWCVFFVNMEKQIKRAYYPFTLSLKDPEALFAFYDGQCMITVFVDLNVIEERLRKRGVAVEFYEDGDYFLGMDNPQTLMRDVRVSHHFIGRLGAEFLSLKWMIQTMHLWTATSVNGSALSIDTNSFPGIPHLTPMLLWGLSSEQRVLVHLFFFH